MAYTLFSKIFGHAGNVDKFLIYLKQKERIRYQVMEQLVTLELQNATMKQVITILKEGYGTVYLHVSTSADFIRVDQTYLTEENFSDNECKLPYMIELGKLEQGDNEGAIFIETDDCTIEIPILVEVPENQVIMKSSGSVKSQIVAIVKLYLAYRMKKIKQKKWFEQSLELVEELLDDYPQDILIQLCQVQLLVVNERKNEAKWALDVITKQLDNTQLSEELYTYYVYLSTFTNCDEEFVLSATAKITILYEQHPIFWTAWLLAYMKEEYQKDFNARLELFKQHGTKGCNSPFLYLEVLQIYNKQPNLLEYLDQFALETIYFGMKYDGIEQQLLTRIQELVVGISEYSNISMTILTYCYERESSIEVLHTICKILIQENLVGEEHYKWYMLAVEQQIRVTNIYEHYMTSMPIENWSEIAQPAVVYFAYSNQLSYEKKTLLYLYVLEHREELEEIIEVYKLQMKEFVIEQIGLGRVNKNLAKLYELVITEEILTEDLAEPFSQIIFQEEITVIDRNVKQVIVVHPNVLEESIYPVIEGKALITVYHKNAIILLEDTYNNRSFGSHDMQREQLLYPHEWYQMISSFSIITPQLDWYFTNEMSDCSKITGENVKSIARLMESEHISQSWKRHVGKFLATFYYEHDRIQELNQMIEHIRSEETDYTERSVFLQYMIKQGFYEKAYEILRDYGTEAHEVKLLVRLCKRLLGMKQIEYDPVILEIIFYVYQNQEYDSTLLIYLAKYYKGSFHYMKHLYFTCMQQGVEASVLLKAIMLRILFCKWNENDHDILYYDYVQLGVGMEYKEAYLKYEAFLYISDEKKVSFTIVEDWVRYYEKIGMSEVISLGIIKFFSDKVESMGEAEEALVVELVKPLVDQKIYFPFFQSFEHLYEPICNFIDDINVVYQAIASNKVSIYYQEYNEEYNEIEEKDNRPYKKID
ncbi:MAG: DUF5717 family protein, partial [Eubacteriales bacterium]